MASLPQAGVELLAKDSGVFIDAMGRAHDSLGRFVKMADDSASQSSRAGATITSSFASAGSGVSSFGQIAIGALREVGAMAVNVAAQAGKALVGFMGDSISVAGDFEAGMNRFSAAAGDSLEVAGLKAADFRDIFLDIGARLPVSTSEVQDAATTLIKGGIDPLILKMGGLESSIQFAAAAGMDLNAAAELSIKQLGTFVPVTASAAEQTAFLASAQDLLVKAAGASTLDVDKLGDAMLAAGGQAKAAGVDYQDFVTVMGLISPSFGSAAEAGTSYKNFLLRLQPATKPATEAMERLGLYTKETGSAFYDATGAFVGNAKAAELLKQATQNLSDADRVRLLQLVFGNDAMGAAVALASGGAEAYDAFAQKMVLANGVQAQATTVQQGYNIAMDNFKGSVEALQITIGSLLLPLLTTLFNTVLAPAVNTVTTLTNALTGNQAAFASLSPPLQGFVLTLQYLAQVAQEAMASFQSDGLMGAISTFAAGLDLLIPGIAGVVQALLGAGPAAAGFAATLAPLGTQIAGVFTQVAGVVQGAITAIVTGVQMSAPQLAAGFAAYQANVGVVAAVFSSILGIVSSVLAQIAGFVTTHGASIVAAVVSTWSAVQQTVSTLLGAVASLIQPILEQIQAFITQNGAEIQQAFATTFTQIADIVQTTLAILNATVVPVITAIFGAVGSFIRAHGAEIQSVLSNSWKAVTTIISTALGVIQGGLKVFLQVVQGDWQGAWSTLQSINETVMNGIVTVAQAALSNLATVFSVALQAALDIVTGFVGQFSSAGADLIRGMVDGVKSAAGALASAAVAAVKDALNAAKGALGISSPSKRANIEIGQPFTQGIAAGIIQAKPVVTQAAVSIGDHLTRETRKSAVDGGSFSKGGGGSRSIGRDFVAGIADGLSKAVSGGGLKAGADQVAGGMLSTVKKPLAINSPSEEAAKQIGSPFVRGIIEGVLKAAPDLFKTLAKTAKDMLAVFDDLGDKIAKAIGDSLSAVGSIFRDAGDAWASTLTMVDSQGARDAARQVMDLQQEERGLFAEMNDARLDAERQRAEIMRRTYDDERERAADLLAIGVEESERRLELDRQAAALQQRIAEAKQAQAAADKTLLERRYRSQEAQDALRALGDEAAKIGDPRKRAEFLRMREGQIQELLQAQLAVLDAQQAIATPGGDSFDEANALAAADLRLRFLREAQQAEQAAFQAGLITAADESGKAIGEGITQAVLANLGTIGTQFATVLTQALGGIRIEPRAAGGPVSSGQPYLVGEQGPELMIPGRSGRIQPLARPAQLARMAAGGTTYGGATYNLNVTTQQSVGSIRAEFGLMQVMAGAS